MVHHIAIREKCKAGTRKDEKLTLNPHCISSLGAYANICQLHNNNTRYLLLRTYPLFGRVHKAKPKIVLLGDLQRLADIVQQKAALVMWLKLEINTRRMNSPEGPHHISVHY